MLSDLQKKVDASLQHLEKPYWSPLSIFARLTEEVGEVGRLLNHLYGDKPKKQEEAKQDLGEEISDVIYACICLANKHNINLDEAFDKATEKINTRDKDRFAKK